MPEATPATASRSSSKGSTSRSARRSTHGEGPLLVLAGAGSGKTRVLTHRIAYLIQTRQARPGEILAITFTNKAAQEMRERVELLLGHSTRAMWVMTFHSACARILRAEAPRLGYTRQFTIYDAADSRRLVKRCIDDARRRPQALHAGARSHHQISDAKNKLRDAEAYRQLVGSYFEQTVADVYEVYERELHRMNAMDFDDLLVPRRQRPRAVPRGPRPLRRDVPPRARRRVPGHEPRAVPAARSCSRGEGHRNLMVVGDDAQCLVEGTRVTMADGTTRPIEDVAVGRRGAVVLRRRATSGRRGSRVAFRTAGRTEGVAITLASGRRIVSTPEHMHFAGYRGRARRRPSHVTYLMLAGAARASGWARRARYTQRAS